MFGPYQNLIFDSVNDGSVYYKDLIVALIDMIGEDQAKLFCQMNCIVERKDEEK